VKNVRSRSRVYYRKRGAVIDGSVRVRGKGVGCVCVVREGHAGVDCSFLWGIAAEMGVEMSRLELSNTYMELVFKRRSMTLSC
jgi:hypothetical protein